MIDRGTKAIERIIFVNEWCRGNWTATGEETNRKFSTPNLRPYAKISSNWIVDINRKLQIFRKYEIGPLGLRAKWRVLRLDIKIKKGKPDNLLSPKLKSFTPWSGLKDELPCGSEYMRTAGRTLDPYHDVPRTLKTQRRASERLNLKMGKDLTPKRANMQMVRRPYR